MEISAAHDSVAGDSITATNDDGLTLFNRIMALTSRIVQLESNTEGVESLVARVEELEASLSTNDWIPATFDPDVWEESTYGYVQYKRVSEQFVVIQYVDIRPKEDAILLELTVLPEGYRPSTSVNVLTTFQRDGYTYSCSVSTGGSVTVRTGNVQYNMSGYILFAL